MRKDSASGGKDIRTDADERQCIYVLSIADGCRYKLVTRGDVRHLSEAKIKRYLAANTGLPVAAQELTLDGHYLLNEASSSSKELLYNGAVLHLRVIQSASCGVTSSSTSISSTNSLTHHQQRMRVVSSAAERMTARSSTTASTRASSLACSHTASDEYDASGNNDDEEKVPTGAAEVSDLSCAAWRRSSVQRSGSELRVVQSHRADVQNRWIESVNGSKDDAEKEPLSRRCCANAHHSKTNARLDAAPGEPLYDKHARQYEHALGENELLRVQLRTMGDELHRSQCRAEATKRKECAHCRALRERVTTQERDMASMQQRIDELNFRVREGATALMESERTARELRAELAMWQSRQDPRANSPPVPPGTPATMSLRSPSVSLDLTRAAQEATEDTGRFSPDRTNVERTRTPVPTRHGSEVLGPAAQSCRKGSGVITDDVQYSPDIDVLHPDSLSASMASAVRSMMAELEQELHTAHVPLEDIHDTRCFTLHRSSDGTEKEVLPDVAEKVKGKNNVLSGGNVACADESALTLMATYDALTQRLFLYASVLHVPTSDSFSAVLTPEQRLRLYECLLEGSLLGKEMAGGGVGLSREEGIVLMSTSVDVRHSDTRALAAAARPFVEAVRGWKSAVQELLATQPTSWEAQQ